MNFHEIFRKDVSYDNIESHKKQQQSFTLSLGDTFIEKQQRAVKLTPQPF